MDVVQIAPGPRRRRRVDVRSRDGRATSPLRTERPRDDDETMTCKPSDHDGGPRGCRARRWAIFSSSESPRDRAFVQRARPGKDASEDPSGRHFFVFVISTVRREDEQSADEERAREQTGARFEVAGRHCRLESRE